MGIAKCEDCVHTECEMKSQVPLPCLSFRGAQRIDKMQPPEAWPEPPEAIPPMDQIEEEHRLRMVEAGKHFVPTHVSIGPEGYSLGGFIKQKPEDLVPTMKLRWVYTPCYETGSIVTPGNNYLKLQQWWLDRNVINSNGTAGGGRWVDIPVETE